MRRYVVVDLDGTLTLDVSSLPYPDKPLNAAVAEATAAARARGFGVMVLTARGMRTWKNDRALVEANVRPGVEAWLEKHGVARDEVQVAKPWCGPRGFYVDDRNLHPEEFVFRFAGPWSAEVFQAVVVGHADDLRAAHVRNMRVERWLEIGAWRYVDHPDAVELGDALIGEGDGRHARWSLVVQLGGRWVDPAGWLAFEHADLAGAPVVVRRGDAGFAIVPTELVQTVGTDLEALERAVGELG